MAGKDQKEKRRQQEVKAAERQERLYEKLKQFALKLYDTDIDFREAVDRDYENVMRQHSDMAFETNISRKSVTIAVQEDRFRRHFHLYDNLAVQHYVNGLGQRLAPADSERLFVVRLTPSPIPNANTLATGTIYLSTGLVAALESEAQLAYVIAHEMAHVLKDHWRLKSMMRLAEAEYNAKQATKSMWLSAIVGGIGAGIGAASSRSGTGAATGAAIGALAGYIAGSIMNPLSMVDFDKVQEDEADREAFQILLKNNYDVGEIPRLYLALQNMTTLDSRASLGFIGNRKRIRERLDNCKDLIEKAHKAEIDLKKSRGELVGDNPLFRHMMAELKRDNGIMAYFHDMLAVARSNLSEAVALRSNDSAAHYYYGKVLHLTARSDEDRRAADEAFRLAAEHDTRGLNFGVHLHQALAMMGDLSNADRAKIVEALKRYVTAYVNYSDYWLRGSPYLPPNVETIYDYLTMLGESGWKPELPETLPLMRTAATAPAIAGEPPPPQPTLATAPPPQETPVKPVQAKPSVPAQRRK
ncbi:MAG: M48 family metalloprotease [Bryobacteraceae bacterium]